MRAVIIIGFGILFLALMVLCLTEIASKADEKADAEFRKYLREKEEKELGKYEIKED